MELTQEYVKALFDYKDGVLYWKVKKSKTIKIGDKAGFIKSDAKKPKYQRTKINIDNKAFYRSRIVFLWHEGWLPTIVDHKDRDETNDKIENLRPANNYENAQNKRSIENSTSKYLGVYKNGKKWAVMVGHKRKSYYLGVFEKENDAALCYNEKALELHGEFANLNIIT